MVILNVLIIILNISMMDRYKRFLLTRKYKVKPSHFKALIFEYEINCDFSFNTFKITYFTNSI